jgi:hypothetical protein
MCKCPQTQFSSMKFRCLWLNFCVNEISVSMTQILRQCKSVSYDLVFASMKLCVLRFSFVSTKISVVWLSFCMNKIQCPMTQFCVNINQCPMTHNWSLITPNTVSIEIQHIYSQSYEGSCIIICQY